MTTSNRVCGSLVVFRGYNHRDLQLDVNLLTTQFPVALADALDRAWAISDLMIAAQRTEVPAYAANLAQPIKPG